MDTSQSLFSRIQKLRGIISENALVDADNVPTGTQVLYIGQLLSSKNMIK